MLFINSDSECTNNIDIYGQRAKSLFKLCQNGIAAPKSFALSVNEFWGDQELLAAVNRIGGFPVTISLGASSSVNYFVDFHSLESDRDQSVDQLGDLKNEIRRLSELYAKQSSAMNRNERRAFSLIIQQKISFEYHGTAYSLDPYLGNEELFFVEIFGNKPIAEVDHCDAIPHQYSVNYYSHSVVNSEVGTGYVNFTNDVISSFSKVLLDIQRIMESPQKVRFGIDHSGKLWITHLKTMTPILYGEENDRYFGMDYLDPNIGFDVYSPLMYSLTATGFEKALRKLFQRYHPRHVLITQRFGRSYLSFEAIRELLKSFPASYQGHIFKALEIEEENSHQSVAKSDWKSYLQQLRIRLKQERLFGGYLDYFAKFKHEFEMLDLKYRAYRQNISSQPHRKLETSFATLLDDYYFPALSLHYCFCLLEISVRSELIDSLVSLGINRIIDKDFLSGIGENPNAILQNRMAILFDVFKQNGVTSDRYLDEKRSFINGHYYYGMNSRDLLFPRWGDDIGELERFFGHLEKTGGFIRVIDESSFDATFSPAIASRLYSMHPIRRFFVKKRIDRIVANFRQIYSARRQLHDYSLRALYILRSYVKQLAENYADLGLLQSEQQVFFLKLDELLTISQNDNLDSLRRHLLIRQQLFSGAKSFSPPRSFGKKDVSSLTPKTSNGIHGVSAANGVGKGKVVLLRQPEDLMRVTSDSILVASEIETGMAFVAGIVKGIVLEHGNTMSQVSSLCRKNGIPLVIRVPNVSKTLREGDVIQVDGESGEISLLSFN